MKLSLSTIITLHRIYVGEGIDDISRILAFNLGPVVLATLASIASLHTGNAILNRAIKDPSLSIDNVSAAIISAAGTVAIYAFPIGLYNIYVYASAHYPHPSDCCTERALWIAYSFMHVILTPAVIVAGATFLKNSHCAKNVEDFAVGYVTYATCAGTLGCVMLCVVNILLSITYYRLTKPTQRYKYIT
ncbi:hypothetical protein BDQ17DRAFT_1369470 [Cyathus striatus]|nr:hypothetical protein BDQ17DRAFT_1369470 [Cyathus striatus]